MTAPSTFKGEPSEPGGIDWTDSAELHRGEDQGGVLHRFKSVRRGTLAELVQFVTTLPEGERGKYVIDVAGDHRLKPGEILSLARHPTFPPA